MSGYWARCCRRRCGWPGSRRWRWCTTARRKPSACVHYHPPPCSREFVAQPSIYSYCSPAIAGLVSDCWRAVRPRCHCRRSRRQRQPVTKERGQAAHSLHQRVERVGDVGNVKGDVVLVGRVEGAIPASHPTSLHEPPVAGTPGECANYHHSAPVLVVGQHITHLDGVVPRRIGEGEYDVVLL